MQASGTEIINGGRTHMYTTDKNTEKKIFKHHTAQSRACMSKSTKSFLKG